MRLPPHYLFTILTLSDFLHFQEEISDHPVCFFGNQLIIADVRHLLIAHILSLHHFESVTGPPLEFQNVVAIVFHSRNSKQPYYSFEN